MSYITTDQIFEVVASTLEVTKTQMMGGRGKQHVSDARFIAIKLVTECCEFSTPANVGRIFNRDHSSVLHALKQFDALVETDKFFRGKYEAIKQLITMEAA